VALQLCCIMLQHVVFLICVPRKDVREAHLALQWCCNFLAACCSILQRVVFLFGQWVTQWFQGGPFGAATRLFAGRNAQMSVLYSFDIVSYIFYILYHMYVYIYIYIYTYICYIAYIHILIEILKCQFYIQLILSYTYHIWCIIYIFMYTYYITCIRIVVELLKH